MKRIYKDNLGIVINKAKVFLLLLITILSTSQAFSQIVNNGSMNGTVGNNKIPTGWTNVNGKSGSTSRAPTPDVLSTSFPSFIGGAQSSVTPTASPDGGSWLGLSEVSNGENEAVQQNITGLTTGSAYKIQFYVANFGADGMSVNSSSDGRVSVYINNTKVASSSLRAISNGWETVTGTFIAPSTSAVLQLDVDSGPAFAYMSIDGASVVLCNAGSTAPSVNSSITNSCPTTTVNLNNAHTGVAPASTTIQWFTDNAHTNAVATPTAAGAGTYYAFYYDNTNNCYSPASQAVTATLSSCAQATVDCPKTQITPAPVQGTPNQMFLIVTANVTTAGTFPVSVSGSGFSLYGISSVSTTTTGVQTFKIPVQYDGSTLGTLTFNFGSGSCTANLNQNEVVNTNCNTWTLDKCTPQVVAPVLK